jgi:hypothetical protein
VWDSRAIEKGASKLDAPLERKEADMDEGEDTNTDEGLPGLDVVAQAEVPFLDELLLAVQGVDGDIYVPVTPFAQRLGLAQPHRQVARIRRDETMEEALRMMPIKTAGGTQDMHVCGSICSHSGWQRSALQW